MRREAHSADQETSDGDASRETVQNLHIGPEGMNRWRRSKNRDDGHEANSNIARPRVFVRVKISHVNRLWEFISSKNNRPSPCLLMGCGASKGPFFKESDPPHDVPMRDKVLLAIMGSPDRRPTSPPSMRATSAAPCRVSPPTLSNCRRPSRRWRSRPTVCRSKRNIMYEICQPHVLDSPEQVVILGSPYRSLRTP